MGDSRPLTDGTYPVQGRPDRPISADTPPRSMTEPGVPRTDPKEPLAMSDVEAPREEDTPAPDSDTPDVPWQKRYEDLRPEFDRTTAALKDEQSVWDDEQALLARIAEKHPHLLAEEDEPEEDDELDEEPGQVPAAVQKELDELRTWRQSIDGERGDALYEKHLAEELGDREVPTQARAWIKDRTISLGAHRNALKQAVEEFDAITEQLGSKKKKPKAPHVPKGGQPGTGVKDWSQMTRDEQVDHMVERARALEAETQ